MTRIVVVGAGNPDRGDDGAGVAVAECVAAAGLPGVRVAVDRGDPVALIDVWEGAHSLWVIDACRSGAPPGTVRRFDPAVTRPRALRTSHGLSVVDAVELARSLGRLPARVWVYVIEAGSCDPGASLSDPVVAAVQQVAGELLAEASAVG